ncbi:MAG TPA: VWA domain-containing protein [Kofleriaceae bacterium]|jgi:hypothetical protein
MKRFAVVMALAACGGSNSNSGGDVDGGPTVDTPAGCSAGCPDGQFCSGANECIDDGMCKVDADCTMPGFACSPAGTCVEGGCGGTHLALTYVAPNVEIVLDRSCSMTQTLAGGQTKWDAAVAALNHVLTDHASDIRWGATMFPDTTGQSCAQDAIPFPVGNNNAAGIMAMFTAAQDASDPNFPDGPCVTNIDTGVEQAAADPALAEPNRMSFMMLVTDGAQSGCSLGGGASGARQAIADALTAGVHTFVVGFGSEVNANQLNNYADAGGEALSGNTHYYQADDAAALDQAFQAISSLTVSCKYKVDPAPTDLSETWVYFMGTMLIPYDPTDMEGWDFDAASSTLTFYGTACDSLRMDPTITVDVIYGCPTPPLQ